MAQIRPTAKDMEKRAKLHGFLKNELVSRFSDVKYNAKQRMLDKYGEFDEYDEISFDTTVTTLFAEVEQVLKRNCTNSELLLNAFLNGCFYASDAPTAEQ